MSKPILTYNLNWGNNTAQKLSGKSYVNPSGQTVNCSSVSITFSSSLFIEKFYATAVKEGNDYGFINDELVDIRETNPTGIKLHELTKRNANTDFQFNINYSSFTVGDGVYRIGLYVQDSNGTWNYEYFFLTNDNKFIELSNGDIFQVPVKTN